MFKASKSEWIPLSDTHSIIYVENEPPKPNKNLVEVVRCRECIHYGRDSERNTYGCNLHSIGMTPSDFCSYGEGQD